jgi:hypothetical protein
VHFEIEPNQKLSRNLDAFADFPKLYQESLQMPENPKRIDKYANLKKKHPELAKKKKVIE